MRNLKRILRFVLPYKWRAVANILFNLLSAFFSLFSLGFMIPFLGVLFGTAARVEVKPEFAFSVDAITDTIYYHITQVLDGYGKEVALLYVVSFVLGASLLKNLFAYIALWHLSPLTTGVVKDLRDALHQKVLSLPLGYYTEERKGDMISRMSNDVNEVEYSIVRSLDMLFRDPITIVVHLAGLLFISPQLTLFVFILLPISGFAIGRVGRNLRKQSTALQASLGNVFSFIDETLGGIRIIKAFNAENRVHGRFARENSRFAKLNISINRRRDMASPLSEFLGTVVMAIVLWFGGRLVFEGVGGLAPEALIGFMGLFYMILNPAKSFSSAYFNVLKGAASADRIMQVLEAENPIKSPENPLPTPQFSGGIEYRNVCFAYGEKPVINDVSLTIQKGQTVALVGQSGSGKTTLADLLPRFYDVQLGQILLDGHDIREYRVSDLRGLMGIVNQEPILFNDTFYNNIAFGVENATLDEVQRAAKIANAHEFIMATPDGYSSNIGDRGSKLSGGQRQRISIARAILKNPPIMILDEATSSLDTESERLVQEALDNLMRDRTSLVIAHRLSTIVNADQICVLKEGRIVERGCHAELLALGGEYAKLCSLQGW